MMSLAKLRVAHADRLFRARLQLAAKDDALMWSLSPERRAYVLLALRAMDWWIASGRAGQPAPLTPILAEDAAPRDRIIAAYLEGHPFEDFELAFRAIRAQAEHMAASGAELDSQHT